MSIPHYRRPGIGKTRMGLHTPGQVELAVTNAVYEERMRAKHLMNELEAEARGYRNQARDEGVSSKDGKRFMLIAETIEWAALKVAELTVDPIDDEEI